MTRNQLVVFILLASVGIGVACAGVVWYLERFQSDRMFTELRDYLRKVDAFRAYERGEDASAG